MTFTFLSGIYLIKAQNITHRVADSLYISGDYTVAAIEYEKIYFGSDDANQRALARLMRVQCLKQCGRYSDALSDLNELLIPGLADSLLLKIRYQLSLCSYLSGDFKAARAQLELYHYLSAVHEPPDEIYLLEILIANQLFDYSNAHELALKWISKLNLRSGQTDSLERIINQVYNKKNQPRVSKEKTAGMLSSFVPGSGQVYAGYGGEGLVNFLLAASVLGTGTYAFIEGYYLTGYFFGAGMLQKLYFGGIRRARLLSEKGNYQRTKGYNDQLRDLMLGIYSISK